MNILPVAVAWVVEVTVLLNVVDVTAWVVEVVVLLDVDDVTAWVVDSAHFVSHSKLRIEWSINRQKLHIFFKKNQEKAKNRQYLTKNVLVW